MLSNFKHQNTISCCSAPTLAAMTTKAIKLKLHYDMNFISRVKILTAMKWQIQWNSVNKSTSGQPVLDLIRGGFNNRIFYNAI